MTISLSEHPHVSGKECRTVLGLTHPAVDRSQGEVLPEGELSDAIDLRRAYDRIRSSDFARDRTHVLATKMQGLAIDPCRMHSVNATEVPWSEAHQPADSPIAGENALATTRQTACPCYGCAWDHR
jgi:hypothetical protein